MAYNLRPDERASLELRGLYEKFGYKKYMMGKFEEYSLYVNNSDFLNSEKVLTFTDLDGRLLALKPDVTLSVINNTVLKKGSTEKLYYIENVYRENRESHSFKEISQMGLEYLGNITKQGVLEVIMLAAETLKQIDKDNILEISNMNYAVDLLDALGLKEKYYLKALRLIRLKNITGIRELAEKTNLDEKAQATLCELPFLYGKIDETIARGRELALNEAMVKDLDQLEEYCQALKELGYGDELRLDLSMVNDIDYYNDITFRGYIRNLPGCVLAGGQYDKAMQVLKKEGGAIGFAVYLDELNKGENTPARYDVDAVIEYGDDDGMVQLIKGVKTLQNQGLSVRTITAADKDIRYKEKYLINNGELVKESESC